MTENKPMSVGDWLITMIVTSIPIVGLIMLLVWAFSSGTNESKKNWAKAALIFYVIMGVLWFVFLGSMMASLADSM